MTIPADGLPDPRMIRAHSSPHIDHLMETVLDWTNLFPYKQGYSWICFVDDSESYIDPWVISKANPKRPTTAVRRRDLNIVDQRELGINCLAIEAEVTETLKAGFETVNYGVEFE